MATPSSVTTWVLLFIVLGYGESKYNGSNDAGGTVDRIQLQSLGSLRFYAVGKPSVATWLVLLLKSSDKIFLAP